MTANIWLGAALVAIGISGALVGRSPLGALNFVVLQWFGVRLAPWYMQLPVIPTDEYAEQLHRTLYRSLCKGYGIEPTALPPPKPDSEYPTRNVRGGWMWIRWVWPLTGWVGPYRYIKRSARTS